jgi:choline-sulfatase
MPLGPLQRPNIVILISDQTRHPMHWPPEWVRHNLPALQRLMDHGLTFRNAYTAACECSPSRGAFLTSLYPEKNGVTTTPPQHALSTTLANLATVLQSGGYPVIWKGKWHLSFPVNLDGIWSPADITALADNYQMQDWNPPDAGTTLGGDSTTLGGGIPNNDGRFVVGVTNPTTQTAGVTGSTSALDFLNAWDPLVGPFCLVVSLVNPHDVFLYPSPEAPGTEYVVGAGYSMGAFQNLPIDLPPNLVDDLLTKPSVQLQFRNSYNGNAPLQDLSYYYNYVRYYAYLHTQSDQLFNLILDVLQGKGLTDNTIVIRMADHGEMGLSHGLREKMYTAYEEAIHVPFIVSNPVLWPKPKETDALASLIDLVPTVAEIAGAVVPEGLSGKSLVPVLDGRKDHVQEEVLYTFDDNFGFLTHIRTLRTRRYKYSVYFNESGPADFEYELYDLDADILEMTNLVFGTVSPEVRALWNDLHDKLTKKLNKDGAMPQGVTWPVNPGG